MEGWSYRGFELSVVRVIELEGWSFQRLQLSRVRVVEGQL